MTILMKISIAENRVTYLKISAPKLKGRPRRKRKKRSTSPGESSNESEASVASTSKPVSASIVPGLRPPSAGVRRSERKTSTEEKRFISDVQTFMNSRGTPVGKMPLLGYKQIDLFLFYTKVKNMGGYESVSAGRLWKSIYDEIGGNTGSTSAATITRRHYERLLLPFERHQRGEEIKIRPAHGRRSKTSISEGFDIKQESDGPSPPPSQTQQSFASSSSPTSTTVTPPLQSILSMPFLPGDKPKSEAGKISSLRSVRVKPERLKSLNTIIANAPSTGSQLPSPPPSNTPVTTPTSTPSTTPIDSQSVLERQLNSPLMSHQLPPSSPPHIPAGNVNTTHTNATAVVTLTPPPEKDLKELKLDSKQTTLLAQGKENIPMYEEKVTIVAPRSPEVIDLETETDTSRDKIIIPSFKKRKLEILREGGLEVTAVDLEARPSVIQATITPVVIPALSKPMVEEKTVEDAPSPPAITNSGTKLISVTVTPDIGHMLPSPQDNQNLQSRLHPQHYSMSKQPTNNNTSMNNNNVVNSRVINLGTANNSSLLQLYASMNDHQSNSNHGHLGQQQPPNGRIPPKVIQSTSIFNHNERMVYGNPKDIMMPQKYQPSNRNQNTPSSNSSGVLDLTQRSDERPPHYSRPSLEIVRVPVVPKPSLLNLEMRSREKQQHQPPMIEQPKKSQGFNYPANMLDSRTLVSNNLEITLVNPASKQKPQQQISSAPPPHMHQRNNPPGLIPQPQQRRQHHHHVNGKYPLRNEPIPSYTTRKSNHNMVIPNIPNVQSLNQLNNIANSSYGRNSSSHQFAVDRRKSEAANKEHRRNSESDRCSIPQMQQQQQQQQQQQEACERQGGEAQQRHHNLPPNYHHPPNLPPMPPNPAFLSQLNNHGKYLPMFDPMYYSAIYNGMFPPPIPPSGPYLPPEVSAYYKEQLQLFANQPARLAMAGQPTVPTSK